MIGSRETRARKSLTKLTNPRPADKQQRRIMTNQQTRKENRYTVHTLNETYFDIIDVGDLIRQRERRLDRSVTTSVYHQSKGAVTEFDPVIHFPC